MCRGIAVTEFPGEQKAAAQSSNGGVERLGTANWRLSAAIAAGACCAGANERGRLPCQP
ncbi:hypothetical protein [Microbulbifer halophilus]|uniref:hypothetical protein n=1 Tax=Microbulbifer halophilus TaxID=453963 RepID=UPI00360A11B2